MCGAPEVLMWLGGQSSFHRITIDIFHDSLQLFLVTDPMIVGLMLPERPASLQDLVCLVGRETLEAVHDARERPELVCGFANFEFLGDHRFMGSTEGHHQEMDVIGHHAIGQQAVLVAMQMIDAGTHESGQTRLPKVIDLLVTIEVVVVDGKQLFVDAIAMLEGGLTSGAGSRSQDSLRSASCFRTGPNRPIQSERHECGAPDGTSAAGCDGS